ncbi:DUF2637 domain-containing protein [Actinomadura sp. 9N407]|uniref:DUF2637 domain-containing protein n=1 Tax=Actinomadura sp. 9N407 TaxID=3375154 RepID=UPI00379995F2
MTIPDRLIRWSAALSVCAVTVIAAVISYAHAYELVARHGESGLAARVLPLTVDGLIATCSLVLLDCARRHRPAPRHAWTLLATGVAATLAANVAHGAGHGLVGAVVAGRPALVAVGSFELLIRLLRDRTGQPPPGAIDRQETDAGERASDAGLHAPADRDQPDPMVEHARERFSDLLSNGRLPSLRALKRELHLGHDRATRIQATLARRP